MVYSCEECGSRFPKLSQLLQHRRTAGHWKKYTCSTCKKVFNRKGNLDRHRQKHQNENNYHCPTCSNVFISKKALEDHIIRHENQTGGAAKRTSEEHAEGSNKKRRLEPVIATDKFYNIEKVSERKIEKFNTTASYYNISVKDMEVRGLAEILKVLKQLFASIIDHIAGDIPSNDLIRITMDNPELDYPITLPFMSRSTLTVDRLLSEIERVLQSYEQFVLDETFGIELVHVHMTKGSGQKRKPYVDIVKLLSDKRSIIQIKNSDELCCARALVTALARVQNHPRWESIRKGRKIQETLAKELHEKAGVPLTACGIPEIKLFQKALPDIQIHVLSKEHFNSVIYQGPEGGTPIYLYSHDQHYDIITKITGFLNRSYFCFQCKKGYNNKERHSCNDPCHFCKHIHNDKEEDWMHCKQCNCKFVNRTCYDLHLKQSESGKSTCKTYYRCTQCNQLINKTKQKSDHICGERYCKSCKGYFAEDHLCYMTTVDEDDCHLGSNSKRMNSLKYIFFDFECRQDDQIHCDKGYMPGENNKCSNCKMSTCGTFKHVPNLCVVHKVCDICLDKDISSTSKCDHCGPNERIFSGPETTTLFCKWLFSEENVGGTVICHNFKGYDSYPILNYLHENAILPEVITTGSKYMSIQVPACKLRFIDSLNFIPMALADMPRAFGETELAKGFFPHLYNRMEYQSSVLNQLPDISFYNPGGMKPETRIQFMQWFEQHRMDPFDFQKELLRYCRSDVDILRKCCLRFRSLFMDLTKKDNVKGIDPFQNCITIASACNLVFRRNYLENETIAIIPPHGYRPADNQSVMAYQWLYFMANEKNINIQHGRNIGEKHIGPYKVDGYYATEEGGNVVLEFNGCFWHGCPACFARNTINPVTQSTMADLYSQTMEKKAYLESEGFTYVCIWECQFKKELEHNLDMQRYIETLDLVEPLVPRDAFYGGRTEAFKLFEEAEHDKQLKYYDVTSLYPFINKTGKIPIGHPEIITDNFKSLDNYEGLIKCKILPPRGLYIPVLPSKCNGKLMFSLCRTCSENYQKTACHHLDDERAFIGTWVTDEVKEALSLGYKIMTVYEVWHFKEISQYDPNSKTGGIFTQYVNTFLKVKQEASGWPDWCVNEHDKQTYIHQYYEREGILLDYNKIKENPGLRSLSKLMLNSFWGKFGQRSNLVQTSYIDDPEQFFDMMTSDQQEVKNVRFISSEAVQLDWAYNHNFVEASSRTNVVIAAYTTAQARLKLFSYLKPLGKRVCYCDTDSIIFTTSAGLWEPELGDYLGDLTDETPGNRILQFVTGGPKNYAFTLEKPNKKGQTSICKVRGITLNYKNMLDINFGTVAHMVKENREKGCIQVVDNNKICRTNGVLVTRTEAKDYRIVFDKRVIKDNYITYPYGMM